MKPPGSKTKATVWVVEKGKMRSREGVPDYKALVRLEKMAG
jgi:hypothetical protein